MRKVLTFWLAAFACFGSSAFAAEPAPTKWTIDGVKREALVFLPSTSSKSKPQVTPLLVKFFQEQPRPA